MDLSELDTTTLADAGAFMHLIHPVSALPVVDNDEKPMGLTLVGSDSERARKHNRKAQNRRLASAPQRRGKITAEELEDDACELIVACTIDWYVQLDGKSLEFSPEAVRKFYKRFPAFQEQADRFIGDRGNFLPA